MQSIPAPMSRGELAKSLGISRTTLYRYLRKANFDLPSTLIYPKDVVRICCLLDFPIPKNYKDLTKNMKENGEL